LNLDIASGTRELGRLQLLSVLGGRASRPEVPVKQLLDISGTADWRLSGRDGLGQRRARDGGWPDLRMMVPTELGNVSFGLENGGRNVRSNEL